MTRLVPILSGLSSYVPGVRAHLRQDTGGTVSANYCYGVWLKHLSIAWCTGLQRIPRTVAEVGPGDTIGVGLAALLSGVSTYHAFDVVEYASRERNLAILDELIPLFRNRTGIAATGWPPLDSYLDARGFPSHILTEDHLRVALDEERLRAIRDVVRLGNGSDEIQIHYVVPWNRLDTSRVSGIEMLYSHTVLQHVVDLRATYAAMYQWLEQGGLMSHQIDFGTQWIDSDWNGHWRYSDRAWRLVQGRKPFLLNREPYSTHRRLLAEARFTVVCSLQRMERTAIRRSELAPRWRTMSDDDLFCRSAFVQAVKGQRPPVVDG